MYGRNPHNLLLLFQSAGLPDEKTTVLQSALPSATDSGAGGEGLPEESCPNIRGGAGRQRPFSQRSVQ